MEPVQHADREAEVHKAREAALAQRPKAARLPTSAAWPIDCEPYWLAAHQYYQLAQKFYQAGDHAQGDYCIARGDAYLQLARLCAPLSTLGVAPLLDAKPAMLDLEAGPPSRARLEAKLEEARRIIDPNASPRPTVPAETANASQCDGYYASALNEAESAVGAGLAGEIDEMHYHLTRSRTYLTTWDICLAIRDILLGIA
jgi:hypothetical protein